MTNTQISQTHNPLSPPHTPNVAEPISLNPWAYLFGMGYQASTGQITTGAASADISDNDGRKVGAA